MLFSKKDLQKLIIPLMFEQLLAVSVGMVDTLMVSLTLFRLSGRHFPPPLMSMSRMKWNG